MPTLILICGLPGAGKTTLAKRIESEREALRLTPDEWMASLDIDGFDEPKRAAVENLQWQVAKHALLGVDVILDWGFWSRTERDDFRQRAKQLGVGFELRFLPATRAELWERLRGRNADMPSGTYHIDLAQLDDYIRMFEEPAEDELMTSSEELEDANRKN